MKKTLLALILLLSVLFLTACGGTKMQHCELGINLSGDFKKYDTGGAFDLAYSNGNIMVGLSRISFSAGVNDGVPATLEPIKFAEVYMARSGHTGEVNSYGYVPYYTYSKTNTGGDMLLYLATFYKSPYAYFVITFITDYNVGASTRDMLKYTDGVYLDLE